MRALFEKAMHGQRGRALDTVWDQLLGAETVAALRELGLLEPSETALGYPCDREGCFRLVKRTECEAVIGHTHVAVCREDDDCEPVWLHADQVKSSRVCREVLLAHVQQALGLQVAPPPPVAGIKEMFDLGRRRWGQLDRRVLLAWDECSDLALFLADHQLNEGPALLLVPVGDRLSLRVRDRHQANDIVAAVGLDRLLAFESGRFELSPFARSQLAEAKGLEKRFCYAVESGAEPRERPIDQAEYNRLIANREMYDLFLDTMEEPKAGNRTGGRRELDGRWVPVALKASLATAAAQVMAAGEALRAKDFLNGKKRATRTLNEARKELDVKLPGPRERWRSFDLVQRDAEGGSRYVFRPPNELAYLLLHDLPR